MVAAEATLAATVAEREAALRMLDRTVAAKDKRSPEQQITLGADTQYQEEKFVQDLRDREVAPHVSEYVKGNMGKNSLSDEERQDARRAISQRKRKLIERVFGWSKLDRPAAPGETARAGSGGLVLSDDHRGAKPDAHAEADSD